MSRVAREFGISRQALYRNKTGKARVFYRRQDDAAIVARIRDMLAVRPTYGYKRITVMLNRQDWPRINRKRVYRLMRMHGLVLPTGVYGPKRPHTGKVMVTTPNTRWCSDAFEIKCFNREKVYVAFALDCCDRGALAFVAHTRPLLATDIQDLMVAAVAGRFDSLRTPRSIQWLTDRGGIFRAKDTTDLGKALGLLPCATRAYSPESNGMAEAFVKTFKRDYVYNHDCDTPETVLALLPAWFDDYGQAPHSALAYQSPSEYLANHIS